MKIRNRIIIGLFLVVGFGFYQLVDWIISDLEPQYRKSTEDPLVDTSRVLAGVAGRTVTDDGQVDVELFRAIFDDVYAQRFVAQIYDFKKTKVDYRVYITDTEGIVIFDSDNGRDLGTDYSEWRDVSRTLVGEYGARTSRDVPGRTNYSVMYVGAPIVHDGNTIGVLSVGKPTFNTNTFTEDSKRRIVIVGIITASIVLIVAIFLSRMVTSPIQQLMDYAVAVRDGKRTTLPELGSSELKELGESFEEMRDALEGKQYVERYVEALTHEVKSPVSAIRGAVELLHEQMDEAQRAQFLNNIENEAKRIQAIVEKLLLLSSLENRKELQERVEISLSSLIENVISRLKPVCEAKGISLHTDIGEELLINGDSFLLEQAISNLLGNSIDFTPQGGSISVQATETSSGLEIVVSDSGSGFPDYALDKVFDRFYSLRRPETGKKSSGLGLSLVKEIAELHGGSVAVSNGDAGGAQVKMSLKK